jgi:hypothetical protein
MTLPPSQNNICLGDIVFLGETVEERRRGVCSAAAIHVHL